MHTRPLPVGAILFGAMVLVGSADRVRRQVVRDPFWAAQNWRNIVRKAIGWFTVGSRSFLIGIVTMVL